MRYGIVGCLMLALLMLPLALSHAEGPEPKGEPKPQWKAEVRKQLKAYPEAKEGMVRYALFLEPKADESLCQVELIVGKAIETDGVNKYGFMGGGIEAKDVEGWGYPMYEVPADAFDRLAQTLIGVPPGQPKVKQFVSLGGTTLVRYNSKLPVVVYVPAGGEVRYRVWEAPAQATPMLPG